MNKKKILLCLISVILGIMTAFGFYNYNKDKSTEEIVQSAIEEIKEYIATENINVSEQTEELSIQTKEAVNNDEEIATTETIESSIEEEEIVTDEGAVETDAVVEQENISYNGTNTGNGLDLLGKYQGLTYYSQADSRWANKMYSSTGDSSQTMKSSACRTNIGSNSCFKFKRCNLANYNGSTVSR